VLTRAGWGSFTTFHGMRRAIILCGSPQVCSTNDFKAMKTKSRLVAILPITMLALAALTLSGCGTTTTSRAGSGAAFGAATGAAIGSLSATAGRGALIGAGAGALGGFLYDQHRRGNID